MKFQLISDAIRNGDSHKATMDMADFWLLDKTLVHKLFKVLAPRYENYTTSLTRMYKAPREYPCVDISKRYRARSILELKGNPYPPVVPDENQKNRNLIHNVLLAEAKKEFNREKKKSNGEVSRNIESITKQPIEKINESKE